MNTTAEIQDVQDVQDVRETDVGNYKRYQPFSPGVLTGATEVWKDIEGYEGKYQISSFGRVKSLARIATSPSGRWRPIRERIMALKTSQTGYHCLALSKDSSRTMHSVHSLVAKAFIPNPEQKNTVNHKDCVKTNNHVSNLEWATHSEQMLHAFANDRIERRGKQKYSTELKKEIHKYYIETGCSINELSRVFGINAKTVGAIAKGVKVRPTTRILKDGTRIVEEMLSKEDVEEIKRLRAEGWTLAKLGAKFNRGTSQIHRITLGKSRNNEIE